MDIVIKVNTLKGQIKDIKTFKEYFPELRKLLLEILDENVSLTRDLHRAVIELINNKVLPILEKDGSENSKDHRFYLLGIMGELAVKACWLTP